MSKINILSETSYGGAKFLDFSMDGKEYVAIPKKGKEQSWLKEFKDLLEFSSKYNLNPFATPLKKDPLKVDKYKKMRMYDRIRYSWNDDTSIKAGPRKGLRHYIDVTLKEDLDKFLEEREHPEAEQLKLKLSNVLNRYQYNVIKDSYMKNSNDLCKNSAWGLPDKAQRGYLLPKNTPSAQHPQYNGGPTEEILNPFMKSPKVISERSDKDIKKIPEPQRALIKKACINKLDKIADELESKGLIKEAFEIDKISDRLEK
jgi:hypothetical protein